MSMVSYLTRLGGAFHMKRVFYLFSSGLASYLPERLKSTCG
jgi:hypothetical protein